MLDLFFQFEMDEESSKLYIFWTTKGLYMFNTMTQEDCSASVDTHDSIRRILSRLDGVVQIKDDIMVKGEGEAHDRQFDNVFERLQHHKITLNFDKCHLGLTEIKWF